MSTRLFILMIMILLVIVSPCYANDQPVSEVTYQVSQQAWASTGSAKVTVNVDASLKENNLATLNQDILQKLKQIADDAEWHIIQFNRTQDPSGLERVQIIAQARVGGSVLNNLRDNAKKISKPGQTFNITDIQFVPSEHEIAATEAKLRQKIYHQAKEEASSLNKMYPEKNYMVYRVYFDPGVQALPEPRMLMSTAAKSQPTQAPVSAKVKVTARVTLAVLGKS